MAISKIKSESIDLTDTGYTFGDLLVSGDLTIDTSSLTVDSANNRVGIGTTTPSSDLHVAKSGSGIIFQTERTDVDGAFSISHTSQKTYLNTDQDYIFLMNGTEAMRIDQSRNVGIGTSDPQTYLHVAGSATILDVPNNGYSGLKISDDTSGDYNIYFDAGRNQAATKFYFRDGGRVQGTSPWTDATPNTAAFISRGTNYFKGSVGIGTTSPSVPLDIEGSGTPININSTNSEVKKIQFENNGTVVGYLASSAGTPFRIFDGTPTELMRIDSSGNVGIGTTSPSDKLNIVNAGDVGVVIQNSNSGSATLSLLATGAGRVRSSGVIIFDTGGSTERMRIDSSGRVGIGETSMDGLLVIKGDSNSSSNPSIRLKDGSDTREAWISNNAGDLILAAGGNDNVYHSRIDIYNGDLIIFYTGGAQRGKWKTDRFLVSASGNDIGGSNVGGQIETAGTVSFNRSNFVTMFIQRRDSDGSLVDFQQDGATEGSISVSGATVSYNGFTGTHWSRLSDNSKPTILKGTILESLDEMMDWYQVHFTIQEEGKDDVQMEKSYVLQEGESVGDIITYNYEGTDYQATIVKENDVKHSKAKVSDTSESKAVYGVFVDWDNDDDTVNDMYVAQTGTFVVRMNSAETVSKGDLIQSNGDGTGKVQADDIIRSSTVAKVLSTTKIETYSDGSYIVPCSLHC